MAWHASAGRSTSTISFDGKGYLFTEQFGTEADFSDRAIFQTIMLFLRPNDASRGLAMYAYQTQVTNTESCACHMIIISGVQESVSLEVFYLDGYLNVLISHHDDSSREILVNHTEMASGDE